MFPIVLAAYFNLLVALGKSATVTRSDLADPRILMLHPRRSHVGPPCGIDHRYCSAVKLKSPRFTSCSDCRNNTVETTTQTIESGIVLRQYSLCQLFMIASLSRSCHPSSKSSLLLTFTLSPEYTRPIFAL